MAQKPTQRPDFEKYQYGGLAARLASSEDSVRYAPGALEVLAGAKGLGLGEEALGFIRGTQASEKGIETAINIYAGKFKEKRGEYKPVELADWYQPVIGDLDKEDKDKILATLKEYDESLNAIEDAFKRADYILKAPEGLFTPEQKAKAKKTKEKYQSVLGVLQILDGYKFETLRPDAVDATRKLELKGLASKL